LEKENEMYPEAAYRMQFTSNHDENTWNGTVYEKYGDGAEAFAVLIFMIPGMPLIYNGQEAGLSKRLQFFEKDPIEWKDDKFKDLYIKLIELKKENEALFSGEKGGEIKWLTVNDNIFSFIREKNGEKIVAVFNLSGKENSVELESTLIEGDYKEFNSGKENEFNSSASYNLKPWEYKIFYKN
ncbi:MAG TPA: alpha-glucosidase C-terminal domain-containing protein, partial [Ignavibacteriaceae bacterium]|nr:alpha-glucosidase C-terminal domain-containing protein [Ignavibacteriaceae bacterium]